MFLVEKGTHQPTGVQTGGIHQVIVNLPTAEALEGTALKLYFRAWNSLLSIILDFDQNFDLDPSGWSQSNETIFEGEREEYLEAAQEELHATLSLIQQSNEIALKARVAAVSPYLLLLNNEVGFGSGGNAVDFSSLRTLDAVDLPKAVNTLTEFQLSDAYIQQYGQLRLLRNRFAHLGDSSSKIDPFNLSAIMGEQYLELWPSRAWLSDRVEYTHSREWFFEGKHWSSRQEVMFLLDYDRAMLPAHTFKKLFGVKKSAVKFGCFRCQHDWAVSRNGPGVREAPTSFYKSEEGTMFCLICNASSIAEQQTCKASDCDGMFFAPVGSEYGTKRCYSCGREPSD